MSPYSLLQEELGADPWKIFVCCIFCNLTKRVQAEPYFWQVMARWPTPRHLAAADQKELQNLIQPLGLAERRSKALIKMSYEYSHKNWKKQPDILYGIGKYASDAYRIFCTETWESVTPKDGALVNYLNWRKSQQASCKLI